MGHMHPVFFGLFRCDACKVAEGIGCVTNLQAQLFERQWPRVNSHRWHLGGATRRWQVLAFRRARNPILPAFAFRRARNPTLPALAFRRARNPILPALAFRRARNPTLPALAFRRARNPTLPALAFRRARNPTLPALAFRRARNPILPVPAIISPIGSIRSRPRKLILAVSHFQTLQEDATENTENSGGQRNPKITDQLISALVDIAIWIDDE